MKCLLLRGCYRKFTSESEARTDLGRWLPRGRESPRLVLYRGLHQGQELFADLSGDLRIWFRYGNALETAHRAIQVI